MVLPDRGYINTIGKDDKPYQFIYTVRTYVDKWNNIRKNQFMVTPIENLGSIPFDFQFVELPNKTIKVTDMFIDYGQYCKGKGLPEALICEVSRLFPEYNIVSSSNIHKSLKGEWRSEQGSAVWERLVRRGKAIYSKEHDIYHLIKLQL